MKFNFILLLLVLLGCEKQKHSLQEMDFETFKITVPKEWKKVEAEGIDSYVGKIAIDENDTLKFDYGWYSYGLEEELPIIIEKSALDTINLTLMEEEYLIIDSFDNFEIDSILKNNVKYEYIDEMKSKIVVPKKSGIGLIGVCFDSVGMYGTGKIRFNLYGINLNPKNEIEVIKAIKTLKFTNKE